MNRPGTQRRRLPRGECAPAARAACVLVFALAGAASALYPPIDPGRLAVESDCVVRGEVWSQESRWVDEERGLIETVSKFYVRYAVAGEYDDRLLRVVTQGGTIGDLTLRVSTEPRLIQGDEVLLCLQRQGADEWKPAAGYMSAWHASPGFERAVRGDGGEVELAGLYEEMTAALRAAGREVKLPDDWLVVDFALGAFRCGLEGDRIRNARERYILGSGRWPGDRPFVTYFVNVNASSAVDDHGTPADFLDAIIEGANAWDTLLTTRFDLRYAGPTTATGVSRNGVNEVMFFESLEGVHARTFTWATSGELTEADFFFNDFRNFSAFAPQVSGVDVQTVAAHEFGHWLPLDHDGFISIMRGVLSANEIRHQPALDDIAGIEALYPEPNPPPMLPPGNDLPENAFELCPPAFYSGDNRAAEHENIGFGCNAGLAGNVWFSYIPATDGELEISMCGSGALFDIAVRVEVEGGGTEHVACSLNICSRRGNVGQPLFTAEVEQGLRYIIHVANRSGDDERGLYQISFDGPACGEARTLAETITRVVLRIDDDPGGLDQNGDSTLNVADIVAAMNAGR